jgi:hypothetical protein
MYPKTLVADEQNPSEVKVFASLRDGLSDEWEVFHSVSWMIRDHAEGSKDGEIDFVLCHPDEGILCLEVKGSGIECRHGEWSRLADGKRERIKDPFKQALDHTYALRRKIEEQKEWKASNLFIAHALAFPQVTVHQLALAPDAPAEILIDRNDLKDDPEGSVRRALDFHRGSRDKRKAPGEEGAQMLRQLLAPDVQIEVPMAEEFLDEEEALVTLTHEQAKLLNHHARNKRMVVTGCAGSGKTMLAVEQAKRRAGKGERVLFTSFNRALREHLARREKDSGVDFYTFHGICRRLAGIASVELPDYGDADPPQSFWDEDMPLALIEAIERIGPQYDALFVDEAQDISNLWLEALVATLADPEKAHIWLFMDDNQRVYDQNLEVPDDFHAFDLTVNCRNTQAIHHEVMKKYSGDVIPEVAGPPGRDVELYKSADQAETVSQVLEHLVEKGEVPPQDIVVLSGHGYDNSDVVRNASGKYELVRDPKPLGNYVRAGSIRGFKGLESRVVVLCELDAIDPENFDAQIYTGMSRAKNHCVVVVPG